MCFRWSNFISEHESVSHSGSFGRVYKGKCRNKIVAIKRYLPFQQTIKLNCFHLIFGKRKTDEFSDAYFCLFVAIEPTHTAPSQMWTCSAERSPSSVASTTPVSSSLWGHVWTTPVSLPSWPSMFLEALCSLCCMNRRGEEVCTCTVYYTVCISSSSALWLTYTAYFRFFSVMFCDGRKHEI